MNAPSYQALVPKLVQREDLTNAIALNSAQFNMSRILGPTLGGYAMVVFGVAGNFFLNGVSFLAVLWALIRIRYPEEKLTRHESMWRACGAVLRICTAKRQMRVLMWMTAVVSLFGLPFHHLYSLFRQGAAERRRKRPGLAAGLLRRWLGAGRADHRRAGEHSAGGALFSRAPVSCSFWRSSASANRTGLRSRRFWHFSRASAGS